VNLDPLFHENRFFENKHRLDRMSAAKKRGHSSVANGAYVAPPTPAASRQDVLGQLEKLPSKWTEAASTYGVLPQLDEVLCASGKHIARSIQFVTEAAEAARQKLERVRKTFHEAIDHRIGDLLSVLSAAQSAKVAALEQELEKLDEMLERTRREHAAAKAAAKTPDDTAYSAVHCDLGAQLDALSTIIAVLPVGPVEPAVIRVDVDIDSLMSQISAFGTVIAPRGVLARHVEVRGLPKHSQRGRPLHFELALSADYPCTAPAELVAAAASLVSHVQVDVSMECGEVSQPLLATLAPASGGRHLFVSVSVPSSAGLDSYVAIHGITVAGQIVTKGQSLPARVIVLTCMLSPLRLEGAASSSMSSPAISGRGTLYAPVYNYPEVLVFSADGMTLPSLPVASLGLSNLTSIAAFDEVSATLLLADDNSYSSKLVALDAESSAVRWSTGLAGSCGGIAVLPAQGIVITSEYRSSKLGVHRLADGTLLATAVAGGPQFIAADPANATLYVNSEKRVTAFRWNGGALVSEGVVETAGDTEYSRPLAVVPPAPGQHTSYLVVGTCRTHTLLVLSLPDRRLVHKHTLGGMMVKGLAADPSGTALAVCDGASRAVHVLPWPLPGMPPLQ
jgi:hypothetical protein